MDQWLKFDGTIAKLKYIFQYATTSRLSSWLLLCACYWIVAAAGFSGFAGKWGLRDGDHRSGVEVMLDATATKPFLYRQFVPMLANYVNNIAPQQFKDRVLSIDPSQTFTRMVDAVKPSIHFRYVIVYYASYIALFLSLFTLRQLLIDLGVRNIVSIVAPMVFVLAFPYLQTKGGYFYDFTELLFASLAFLAAIRGRVDLLILVTLLATLNKETFIFFLPALYPVLRYKLSTKSALNAVFLAMLMAGIVNVLFKLVFIHANGGAAELHFIENMEAYLQPWTYFGHEKTYGIVGPSGAFFGTIIVISIIVLRAWNHCQMQVRQHLCIAAAINFPLFFVFGWIGELRGLSLLFIGFVILIAIVIEQGINQADGK